MGRVLDGGGLSWEHVGSGWVRMERDSTRKDNRGISRMARNLVQWELPGTNEGDP